MTASLIHTARRWRRVWVVALLCVASGGSAAASDAGVVVDVHPRVEATGPDVRLRDVALVQAPSPGLQRELENIVVCFAPVAGGMRELTRESLLLRLQQQGVDTRAVAVQGAPRVQILAASTRIPAATIVERISSAIREQMPWDPEQVEITPPHNLDDLVVQTKDPDLRVSFLPDEAFLGSTPVSLECYADGERVDRQSYRFDLAVYEDVLLVDRGLPRGTVLGRDDLRRERANIARLRGRYFVAEEEVVGLRLRRSVREGTRLQPDLLEVPPAVARGDYVRISIAGSGYEISAGGRAEEAGAVGTVIRVELPTDRRVYARVDGPGAATLVE